MQGFYRFDQCILIKSVKSFIFSVTGKGSEEDLIVGVNYQYQCSHCKVKFNTSGPWAFYRNKKGERIPYGYPGPLTEEARLTEFKVFC